MPRDVADPSLTSEATMPETTETVPARVRASAVVSRLRALIDYELPELLSELEGALDELHGAPFPPDELVDAYADELRRRVAR